MRRYAFELVVNVKRGITILCFSTFFSEGKEKMRQNNLGGELNDSLSHVDEKGHLWGMEWGEDVDFLKRHAKFLYFTMCFVVMLGSRYKMKLIICM